MFVSLTALALTFVVVHLIAVARLAVERRAEVVAEKRAVISARLDAALADGDAR